jgi:hypothetical protein
MAFREANNSFDEALDHKRDCIKAPLTFRFIYLSIVLTIYLSMVQIICSRTAVLFEEEQGAGSGQR